MAAHDTALAACDAGTLFCLPRDSVLAARDAGDAVLAAHDAGDAVLAAHDARLDAGEAVLAFYYASQ